MSKKGQQPTPSSIREIGKLATSDVKFLIQLSGYLEVLVLCYPWDGESKVGAKKRNTELKQKIAKALDEPSADDTIKISVTSSKKTATGTRIIRVAAKRT